MRLALAALAALLWAAAPAFGQDYDALNGVALNASPHRVVAPLTASPAWNSAAFGTAEEGPVACDGATGTRSAWVRFGTSASGKLALTARAGYDPVLAVYETTLDKNGRAAFGDLVREACVHAGSASGIEIESDTEVYVQVLTASGTGGPTTLDLTFTPNNNDGDDLPNGVDQCPLEAGPANGRPTPGCPDTDGDGVTVPGDECPDQFAVTVNGCPGGPPVPSPTPTAAPSAGPQPTPTPPPVGASTPPAAYPTLVGVTRIAPRPVVRRGRTVGFKGFRVTGAQPGMRVHVTCTGPGCPFRHRLATGDTVRGLRHLPVGTRVTVRPRVPNHIVPAARYTLRAAGPAAVEALCTLPSAPRRLTACA